MYIPALVIAKTTVLVWAAWEPDKREGIGQLFSCARALVAPLCHIIYITTPTSVTSTVPRFETEISEEAEGLLHSTPK